ncbi:DUF416 family protein [Allohahella sp. A8]|uniref:DUF416 family protein n=1 Tax=Allohahella sp. A8 TaxID=3141461 RepID=UPI000C0B7D3A|nr:hypothetical protein [Hahellaceae bacterium]|tara:strand:- start:77393 stop:78202 length:810 start_codon:yes stop_codon:yes gene_type:complete
MQSDRHLQKIKGLRGLRATAFTAALAQRALPHSQLFAELLGDQRSIRAVSAFTESLWPALQQAFEKHLSTEKTPSDGSAGKSGSKPGGKAGGKRPSSETGPDEIRLYLERLDQQLETWSAHDSYGAMLASKQLELTMEAWISLAEAMRLHDLTDDLPKFIGPVQCAQDTINSVVNYLQLQLEGDDDARIELETEDLKFEGTPAELMADDEALVAYLDQHEVLQAELSFQTEVRLLLDVPTEKLIGNLKRIQTLAHNDGVSSLGVSLESE